FRVLKETRKEYWGIQIINFLDCMFYFALVSFVTLFLSHELGLDDKHAGWCYTLFSSATALLLFVSGMWTDWLGIRKSLLICLIAMLLLRLAMVGVGCMPALVEQGLVPQNMLAHRGLISAGVLLLMAPFMAGIQTAFQSACQRYTTKRSRGAGFNLWYLFM